MTPEHPYQLLPALTADEYQALKASIAQVGVLQPVVVTENGTIIDGHHRVRACAELGIDYPTVTLAEMDEESRVAQVIALNLARRHLTPEQKRHLVGNLAARGLSVRGIAEASGIPKSTVHRWLQPEGVPNGTPDRVAEASAREVAVRELVANLADRAARLQADWRAFWGELTKGGVGVGQIEREIEAATTMADVTSIERSLGYKPGLPDAPPVLTQVTHPELVRMYAEAAAVQAVAIPLLAAVRNEKRRRKVRTPNLEASYEEIGISARQVSEARLLVGIESWTP